MRKCFALLTVVAVLLGLAAPGFAADKPKPTVEELFKKADKDGDGSVSEAEFLGKSEGDAATKKKEAFKKLDKDSDGKLTLEEFKARRGKNK
jgi:Ca2+-binding EF-hand superfamily protein